MSHLGNSGARERAAQVARGPFASYLFEQDIAQRVYKNDPRALDGEARVEFIRWNVLAAIKELSEMLDNVDGWKPWQNQRDNAGDFKDRVEFIDDAVDALKFVGNLLLTAGATDEELSAIWRAKTQVNEQRQVDGYAGVGKDHVTVMDLLNQEPGGTFGATRALHGERGCAEDFYGHGEGSRR